MTQRPDVELRIVGKFDITEFMGFEGFAPRITQLPVMPYEEMLLD
jgi:hypothetical protein